MSFNETVERSKLNQAMYKKLKKYIMNKRKQQVERKEHDDHYKKMMLEKAKRRRQAQIDHEDMESLQKELSEATKRRDELRVQKHCLFTKFKQLANDESILKDKQKSEVQQMASSGLPRSYHMQNIPDQMSTSMSNAAIPTSMLGYTPSKIESVNESNSVSSNHSPITMSANDLVTAIRYSGLSPAIIDALYKNNNNTQRILNQTVVSSLLNNGTTGLNNQSGNNSGSASNSLLANSGLNENALAAIFANINNPAVSALLPSGLLQVDLHGCNAGENNTCINQSTNQSLNPLLAQLQQMEKYGGGLNVAAAAALSQQLESLRQGPNNSQRLMESLKQLSNNTVGCYDSFNNSQLSNSAAAFNNLVNNTVMGSALLPPAPTSYRGSITTGQSAQNIQLQVYQQQQQHMLMAKLVNSVNHNSAASQHQTSHLGGVLPQHHNINLPPISTNVLQIGSNPIRQSGQNDSNSLYSSALDQHSPFYNRNIITFSGQNSQQTAAAAVNYSNQTQLAHHLNAQVGLASTPQNYRQTMPQPPHSVHNNYF